MPILLSLTVSNEVKTTTRDGPRSTNVKVFAEKSLQAELLLTPTSDVDAKKLGFVRLVVHADEPYDIPDLNGEQMTNWLCDLLRRMLIVPERAEPATP